MQKRTTRRLAYADNGGNMNKGDISHDPTSPQGTISHTSAETIKKRDRQIGSNGFTSQNDTPPLLESVGEFRFEDFEHRQDKDGGHHIIEVLINSDEAEGEREREGARRRLPTYPKSKPGDVWIQRIRIASPILLEYLQDAVHLDELVSDAVQPCVFSRPFKPLTDHYPRMKQVLEQLERSTPNFAPVDDSVPGTEKNGHDSKLPYETENTNDLKENNTKEEKSTNSNGSRELEHMMSLKHLRCYVDFIERKILPLKSMFDGASQRMARFDDLWFLFKVGDIIYAPLNLHGHDAKGRWQTAFRIYNIFIDPDEGSADNVELGNRVMEIYCYHIDYDGNNYGPVSHCFSIPAFFGQKDIRDLPVYPLRLAADAEELEEGLIAQGRRFRELVQETHLEVAYEGWTLPPPVIGSENAQDEHVVHVQGNAIIDFKETLRKNQSWKPRFQWETFMYATDWLEAVDRLSLQHLQVSTSGGQYPWSGRRTEQDTYLNRDFEEKLSNGWLEKGASKPYSKDAVLSSDDKLEDDVHSLLLPRRLFAFILERRTFAMLDIQHVQTIDLEPTILDDLRIDGSYKLMLQSLIADHSINMHIEHQRPTSTSVHQDLVDGKGSGLTILLHGAPGVGKSATAGVIAKANKRPLITIQCGEMSQSPQAVESTLRELFLLARLWNCILLLDEADIFLARRDNLSQEKNALVSVFLRALDYYTGILFLTTTRVDMIDPAFKSRITISLLYEPLSRIQTLEIFRLHVRKLREAEAARQIRLQGTYLKREPRLLIKARRIIEFAGRFYDDNEGSPHLRWDGRQIRNAFQSAASLARYDLRRNLAVIEENKKVSGAPVRLSSPVLNETHFKMVAEAAESLGNCMRTARVMMGADEARMENARSSDAIDALIAAAKGETSDLANSPQKTITGQGRKADNARSTGLAASRETPARAMTGGNAKVQASNKGKIPVKTPGMKAVKALSSPSRPTDASPRNPRLRPQAAANGTPQKTLSRQNSSLLPKVEAPPPYQDGQGQIQAQSQDEEERYLRDVKAYRPFKGEQGRSNSYAQDMDYDDTDGEESFRGKEGRFAQDDEEDYDD